MQEGTMKAKLTSVVLALLLVVSFTVPFSFESEAVSYDDSISVGSMYSGSVRVGTTKRIQIKGNTGGFYKVTVYCPTEDLGSEEVVSEDEDYEDPIFFDFSIHDAKGALIPQVSPTEYKQGEVPEADSDIDIVPIYPEGYSDLWYAFSKSSSYYIEINNAGDSSNLEYVILIQPVTFMSEYQFGKSVSKSLGNHPKGFCYLIPFTPKNASQAECYYDFYTTSKYPVEDNEYGIEISILDEDGEPQESDNGSIAYSVYDNQKDSYHLNPGQQYFIDATYSVDNPKGPNSGVDGLISWKVSLKALKSTGKLSVKSLWASQHSVGKVLFKWTKKDNVSVSGWNLKYRTRKIGGNNSWSGWTNESYGKNTYQAWIKIQKDHVIEIHAQAKGDTTWSNGIITTPAGGKYQAMKNTYVLNNNTKKRIGSTITLPVGETIDVVPSYEYSIKNYTKRPRLYPNHMLYDVADRSVLHVMYEDEDPYIGGMIVGVATLRGLKEGRTSIIFRSPNGRTQVTTVNVVAPDE